MEYKVIWRDSMKDFEEAVNQALKDGWKLVGAPAFFVQYANYHDRCKFFQAMKRKKKINK